MTQYFIISDNYYHSNSWVLQREKTLAQQGITAKNITIIGKQNYETAIGVNLKYCLQKGIDYKMINITGKHYPEIAELIKEIVEKYKKD